VDSTPEVRQSAEVFAEELSDLLETPEAGRTIVTQVKRQLRGHQLSEALDELWDIWSLVCEVVPDQVPDIGFRVVTSRSRIADVDAAVARWNPSTENQADLTGELFRQRLEVAIDESPERELLRLLINRFDADDPLATIRGWLGRLTEAAAGPQALMRAAASEIQNDLRTLERGRERQASSRIYCWSSADRQPDDVERGSFLVGQRPMLPHLREGRFAPRAALIDSIVDQVRSWMDPHPSASDVAYRLPVFWIGGRSGCGKSIALLQTLARLHEDDGIPILWLGADISALPEAVRRARALRQAGDTVVIGVDDPYSPVAQNDAASLWQDAVAELMVSRQVADASEIPLLVCCGPTEQGERLAADLHDDVVVHQQQMPQETTDERETLRNWYRLRTGSEPPDVGDRNVLMVQLFFEWSVGQILPAFAERFKRRILANEGGAGLVDVFSRILALNRLYVGYPEGALMARCDPQQRTAIDRLRREHHLEKSEGDDRSGTWLAHPHLSNAIYEAWHSPTTAAAVRREHLLAGIEECRTYGSSPNDCQAPLWALARALDTEQRDGVVARRLEADDVAAVVAESYRLVLLAGSGDLPLWQRPVWVAIAATGSRGWLSPDPISAAISAVRFENVGAKGLRLTCHKLLQYLDRFPTAVGQQAVRAICTLLETSLDWFEWPAIAIDALTKVSEPVLWSVVARWATQYPEAPLTPRLLQLALGAAPNSILLRAAALECIDAAASDERWGDVAQALLPPVNSADPIPPQVIDWVERHRTAFSVRFTLGQLVRRGTPKAQEWALIWLRDWWAERTANFILEPLARRESPPAETASFGVAWIECGHANAGMLIKLLLRSFGRDARIIEAGCAWLAGASSTDKTRAVALEHLIASAPDDPEVKRAGRTWLTDSPAEHPSWVSIWLRLWKTSPKDDGLVERARWWLTAAPAEHPSWAFLWRKLWTAFPEDDGLVERARWWLTAAPAEHGSWEYLWEQLWTAFPKDDGLVERARWWLTAAPAEHGSWKYLWEQLWMAFPKDDGLVERARWWLTAAPAEHPSWVFLWRKLWTAFPEDDGLVERARWWLTAAPAEHGSWQYLWKQVWEMSPRDEGLIQEGRQWLATTSKSHHSWVYMWRDLRKVEHDMGELDEQGRRFLEATSPGHPGRSVVAAALGPGAQSTRLGSPTPSFEQPNWATDWIARLAGDRSGAELAETQSLGLAWLQSSFHYRLWASVFLRLWPAVTLRAQLTPLGEAWLCHHPEGRRADDVREVLARRSADERK
jgi:hypothetical protein